MCVPSYNVSIGFFMCSFQQKDVRLIADLYKYMLKHSFVKLNAEKTRKKEQTMIIFIIFVALLFTLDFAAMRWGFDSRDGLDSEDGQRRAIREYSSHRA